MKIKLLSILFLFTSSAIAQVAGNDSSYPVKTNLSKESILSGDRVELTVSVVVPQTLKVSFPVLSDPLIKGVELVKKPVLSSIKLKGNQTEQIIKLLITSFDSGSYQLPELKIAVSDGIKTDTIKSNALTLTVNSIPHNKSMNDIFDIKPPIEEPITIKEVAPWAFGGLLFAGLIFLILLYLKRKKENRPFTFLQKHVDPPHIAAFRELEKIRDEKLWASENHKYFYTRLIDTLRIYIEGRYGVYAMEQTTYEILSGLKQDGFDDEYLFSNLQETLMLADLVKFAKYTPFVSDNERNLKFAFDFVEKTKPIEEVKEIQESETVTTENKEEVVEISSEQDNKIN